MAEPKLNKTNTSKDSKTKQYVAWSKLFLLIAVCYTMWVIIVLCGVYFFNLGYRWSLLTIEQWVIGGCILMGGIVCIQFLFLLLDYSHGSAQKVQQQTYKGNKLYSFTYPVDAKGGLFSRTYIRLDNKTVIRIRTQMITPEALWKKKQL